LAEFHKFTCPDLVERRALARILLVGRIAVSHGFASFLAQFEGTTDPWDRSKLVGERISPLRKSFMEMTEEQRLELAKHSETDLKTGLELMGKDRRTIQELIALVDPPPAR